MVQDPGGHVFLEGSSVRWISSPGGPAGRPGPLLPPCQLLRGSLSPGSPFTSSLHLAPPMRPIPGAGTHQCTRQKDTTPTLDHPCCAPGLRPRPPSPATTRGPASQVSPPWPPPRWPRWPPEPPENSALPSAGRTSTRQPLAARPQEKPIREPAPSGIFEDIFPGSISQSSPGVGSGGAMGGTGGDKRNLLL